MHQCAGLHQGWEVVGEATRLKDAAFGLFQGLGFGMSCTQVLERELEHRSL